MKKVLLLPAAVLLLCFFGLNGSAQVSDSALIQEFIGYNEIGNFNEARQLFDPGLQSKVTSAALQHVWETVIHPHGAFLGILDLRQARQDSVQMFAVLGDFVDAEIRMSFAFNASQKIVGFYIRKITVKNKVDSLPADTRGIDTTIQVSGGILSGTLWVPDIPGKIPVVLIIAGSGPVDRDGNAGLLEQSNAYLQLADSLAVHGIACLRYDKRFVGKSTDFSQPVDKVSFDDYVNDAGSWVQFLRQDPRFSKLVVLGHSEGSLIGILAAEKTRPDAFISLAGAADPIDTVILSQLSGLPGITQQTQAQLKNIFDSLRTGQIPATPSAPLNSIYRASIGHYLISYMKYDPIQEFRKLRIPILILQGTTDLQVTVGQAEMLKKANPEATLVLIEGMNHMLKNAPADREKNMATYEEPNLPLNAVLVTSILDFINGGS